jgi:hypothetical protein
MSIFLDRNFLGESPVSISPKITPQESPPNLSYSAGIHQVKFKIKLKLPFNNLSFNLRKMLEGLHISILKNKQDRQLMKRIH